MRLYRQYSGETGMKILVISTVRYRKNGISTVIKNLYANEVFAGEKITFLFPEDSDAEMVAELQGWGYDVVLKWHSF